jgi:hypothetical protein
MTRMKRPIVGPLPVFSYRPVYQIQILISTRYLSLVDPVPALHRYVDGLSGFLCGFPMS